MEFKIEAIAKSTVVIGTLNSISDNYDTKSNKKFFTIKHPLHFLNLTHRLKMNLKLKNFLS
jgi:hypothetical protein